MKDAYSNYEYGRERLLEVQLEQAKEEAEFYKMQYRRLAQFMNKIQEHLLGKNWVIIDPSDSVTDFEIATYEIMERYKDVNKYPKLIAKIFKHTQTF